MQQTRSSPRKPTSITKIKKSTQATARAHWQPKYVEYLLEKAVNAKETGNIGDKGLFREKQYNIFAEKLRKKFNVEFTGKQVKSKYTNVFFLYFFQNFPPFP